LITDGEAVSFLKRLLLQSISYFLLIKTSLQSRAVSFRGGTVTQESQELQNSRNALEIIEVE